VVDDGVATGATAATVGTWLALAGAARSVLALPVGPPSTLARLAESYDDVLALLRPVSFLAVGQWYREFGQTSDDEVVQLLRAGGAGGP
jgi:predicted phosphoribosyltransferase